MQVLRLVALSLLSSFVLLILLLGTQLLSSLSSQSEAERALLSLGEALEALKATGNPQRVELHLPKDQRLLFENGKAVLAGKTVEVGYPVRGGPFSGRCTLELAFERTEEGWEVAVREA